MFNNLLTPIALSVALLAAAPLQAGGNATAGQTKAPLCSGCHGANGEGKDPVAEGQPAFPALAGQREAYLTKSMGAYRSDERKDPMMGAIAKGLTDDDISNLSAYYSSLK